MNRVFPIKDKNKIEALKELLRSKKKYRDLLLFVMGINTPLHLSTILSMRWSSFLTDSWEIRKPNSKLSIKEERENKTVHIVLNSSIYEALKLYHDHYPFISKDGYLFVSQKTKNGEPRPITRQYVWKLLNEYAKIVGIKERIGAHTLRKTFGYHLYREGVPISEIRKALRQPNIISTLKYIDVDVNEYREQKKRIVLTPDL